MESIKKKKTLKFLDKFATEYNKSIDPTKEKRDKALSYLRFIDLASNCMDDLSNAMELSQREINRLISVQAELIRQHEDPRSIDWVNQKQEEFKIIQQGLLELMLQLREEK